MPTVQLRLSSADHLSAYLGSDVLLEWHDAFLDDPILLSHLLPEARVRAFASRLGVRVEEGPA